MKKYLILFFIPLFIFGCSCQKNVSKVFDPVEIQVNLEMEDYSNLRTGLLYTCPSVVICEYVDRSTQLISTASYVGFDGEFNYFITSGHSVYNSEGPIMRYYFLRISQTSHPVTIYNVSSEIDAAIIKITKSDALSDIEPFNFSNYLSNDLVATTPFQYSGYPLGEFTTHAGNFYMSDSTVPLGEGYIWHNKNITWNYFWMPSFGGASGSLLLNEKKLAVGIVTIGMGGNRMITPGSEHLFNYVMQFKFRD